MLCSDTGEITKFAAILVLQKISPAFLEAPDLKKEKEWFDDVRKQAQEEAEKETKEEAEELDSKSAAQDGAASKPVTEIVKPTKALEPLQSAKIHKEKARGSGVAAIRALKKEDRTSAFDEKQERSLNAIFTEAAVQRRAMRTLDLRDARLARNARSIGAAESESSKLPGVSAAKPRKTKLSSKPETYLSS